MSKRELVCALLSVIALCGCANLEPVGKFGASGLELTKVYRPLVQDLGIICRSRLASGAITREGTYVYKDQRERAEKTCAPLDAKRDVVLEFATVVDGYSNSLVALAGLPRDVLAADLDALNGAAKALKLSSPAGAAAPLVDAKQADAVTSLIKVAAELLVAKKTDAAAKKALEDGREPLRVLVSAMVTFSDEILLSEIKSARLDAEIRLNYMVAASSAPAGSSRTAEAIRTAVPYRALQPYYQTIIDDAEARSELLVKFKAAAQALVATNDHLATNYDKLTQVGRFEALRDLISKIQILRNSFLSL